MFSAAFATLAIYPLVVSVAHAHFQLESSHTPLSQEELSPKRKAFPFVNQALGTHDKKKWGHGAGAAHLLLEKKVARVVNTPSRMNHNAAPVITTATDFLCTSKQKQATDGARLRRSEEESRRNRGARFASRGTTPVSIQLAGGLAKLLQTHTTRLHSNFQERVEHIQENVAHRREALVRQRLNEDIVNCPECEARRRRTYAGYSTGLPDAEIPSTGEEQAPTVELPPEEERTERSAPHVPSSPEEIPEETQSPEYGKEEDALGPFEPPSPGETPEQEEETEAPEPEQEQPGSDSEHASKQKVDHLGERADQEPEEMSPSEAPPHQKLAPPAEGRKDQEGEPPEEATGVPREEQEEERHRMTPTPSLRRPAPARSTGEEGEMEDAREHENEGEGHERGEVSPESSPEEKAALEDKVKAREGFFKKPW